MAQALLLLRFAKSCTPRVAKTLTRIPAFGKSVAEVSKMANSARGSEIGSLLSTLSKTGEKIVGQDGFVSFTTRASKKSSDATIVTAIFKKGNEVVAKIASYVSPQKNVIGGSIGASKIRYSDITQTLAEKIQAIARESGVDMKTVSKRIYEAQMSGKNIKDEQVLKDVIAGKFVKKAGRRKKVFESFASGSSSVTSEQQAHEAWAKHYKQNCKHIWGRDNYEIPVDGLGLLEQGIHSKSFIILKDFSPSLSESLISY